MYAIKQKLIILTADETAKYMEGVPDGPNQGKHQFVHISRYSSANSIEKNAGEEGSGLQRKYSHNVMRQTCWLIRLCKDYVGWDLHHTDDKHGHDEQGWVGDVLEEDHPLINCIKPSAQGSQGAHLNTCDADILTNGLTRLHFTRASQFDYKHQG